MSHQCCVYNLCCPQVAKKIYQCRFKLTYMGFFLEISFNMSPLGFVVVAPRRWIWAPWVSWSAQVPQNGPSRCPKCLFFSLCTGEAVYQKFCNFPKLTIWQSQPLRAVIGQACRGRKLGRIWTILKLSFFILHPNTQKYFDGRLFAPPLNLIIWNRYALLPLDMAGQHFLLTGWFLAYPGLHGSATSDRATLPRRRTIITWKNRMAVQTYWRVIFGVFQSQISAHSLNPCYEHGHFVGFWI